MPRVARLLTFRPSHFCEKARWALDRAGIEYREESHVPVLSWLATYGAGARRTVPALVTEDRVVPDSTDILRWVDEQGRAERLFPDGVEGHDVAALEDEFDRRLGPAARRVVYFHVLADRERMRELFTRSAGRWEGKAARVLLPLLTRVIRTGLRVDAAGAERSREVLDRTFAAVATRLADGRPFLAGERFTAADLTFAALSYPVLWPDAVVANGVVPPLDEAPPALRHVVEAHRASVAGRFALRLYAEERPWTRH